MLPVKLANLLKYINMLLNQCIHPATAPKYYADQLIFLYKCMHLKPNEYPIIDVTEAYKEYHFYERLTYTQDIQIILMMRMEQIVYKYKAIFLEYLQDIEI